MGMHDKHIQSKNFHSTQLKPHLYKVGNWWYVSTMPQVLARSPLDQLRDLWDTAHCTVHHWNQRDFNKRQERMV